MDRRYSVCMGCEHISMNNDDDFVGGCRAFPNGIDNEEIGDVNSHNKPREGQKNDFVYMPAKRKVNRMGRKITIYQDSNPYADENGRYNGK